MIHHFNIDIDSEIKDKIDTWRKNSNNKVSGDSFEKMLQQVNQLYNDWKANIRISYDNKYNKEES